ncbi:MAG: flavin reductase family protein [Actinobacteria bacterium]|nr:flavin reductase family protein [Actinomycetota bacterium]
MEVRPDQFKIMLTMPVTVITTVNSEGSSNAAPYGCVMPILRPLDLIAVASALPRDTLRNIRDNGQFVVNVMGKPGFESAMRTAKNYPPEVSELEAEGIETIPSKKVDPPRISEAIGWIEAVLDQEVTGDNYALTIGRVLCAELNDMYLKGKHLTEPPAVLLNPDYRIVGDSIGDARRTMKLFLGDSKKLS